MHRRHDEISKEFSAAARGLFRFADFGKFFEQIRP
jgi:hypothetical protein